MVKGERVKHYSSGIGGCLFYYTSYGKFGYYYVFTNCGIIILCFESREGNGILMRVIRYCLNKFVTSFNDVLFCSLPMIFMRMRFR